MEHVGVSRSQKDGKPQLLPPRLCSACPLQAISLAPQGNLNHIPPLHKAADVSARNHWPRKNCSGHRLPLPCSVLIPSQTCCHASLILDLGTCISAAFTLRHVLCLWTRCLSAVNTLPAFLLLWQTCLQKLMERHSCRWFSKIQRQSREDTGMCNRNACWRKVTTWPLSGHWKEEPLSRGAK